MLSSVEAIPLLVAPSDSVATGTYVPLSERSFTAEQHAEHERILKHSSIGWNDWNCKPKPGKNPLVMVHGLGKKKNSKGAKGGGAYLGSNAYENFNYMAPRFAAAGYCG